MIALAQILAGLSILVSGMLAAFHPPHSPLPAAEPVVAGPAPVTSSTVERDKAGNIISAKVTPASDLPKQVMSTAYCPAQGPTMADGSPVHEGAVAMNDRPFGSRVRVLTGPLAGAILVVQDRIGWGSQFDVFMWNCWAARRYGLQRILIAPI